MVDMVEKSMPQHISDLQQRNLIPNPNRMQQEIEAEFAAAEREPSRLPYLQKQLKRLNVFEQYQDRFFALVRRKGL
jgi:adenosine deaminase